MFVIECVRACVRVWYWVTPGEITSVELFSDVSAAVVWRRREWRQSFRREQSPSDKQSDCLCHMMVLTWGSSGRSITRSFLEQSELISGGGSSSAEREGQTQQKKVRGSPALMCESHDALHQSDAPPRFSLSNGTEL